jgi:hypothetical protein
VTRRALRTATPSAHKGCPHDQILVHAYDSPYPHREVHWCVRCRMTVLDVGTILSDEEYEQIYRDYLRDRGVARPRALPQSPPATHRPLGPRPCGLPPWGEP